MSADKKATDARPVPSSANGVQTGRVCTSGRNLLAGSSMVAVFQSSVATRATKASKR